MTDWCATVREAGVVVVGPALGLHWKREGVERNGLTPCPVCNAEDRTTAHHEDKRRGPIGLRRDRLGWVCHVCGAQGDAVSLAAAVATGKVKPDRGDWAEVEARCKAAGLIGPNAKPATPRPKPAPMRYPPPDELRELWSQGCPVDLDTDVCLWMSGRPTPLDPGRVADLCPGVIALPATATVPKWAVHWPQSGHRLLVPLYDAGGKWRSVQARAVVEHKRKSLNPGQDFEVTGLVIADGLARLMLQRGELGDGTPIAEHLRHISEGGVQGVGLVIREGAPDYLMERISYSDADADAPAIVGVGSGSWKQGHADKVPDGCVVRVATHDDATGEKYAKEIYQTFTGRSVTLKRWKEIKATA